MKKHNYFYIMAILFLLTACPAHAAESAKDNNNDKNIILSDETLFDPLMADPRWPHFSVAYQSYIGDDELKNVGATSFGETFPLYSGNAFGGRWITGIQKSSNFSIKPGKTHSRRRFENLGGKRLGCRCIGKVGGSA